MVKIRVNPDDLGGEEVHDVATAGAPPAEGDAQETTPVVGRSLGPTSLTQHLGYLLRRAFVVSTDHAKACIADETPLREVALLALLAERAPVSQRELGDLLNVNRTIMVALVDSMESKGWIARERNLSDRRSYALRLTEEGQRAKSELVDDLSRGDDQLTARLTLRERRRLNRLLLQLLDDAELAPIASLSEHSGYLIAQAHRLLRGRAIQALAPLGIDPRDFGVLAVLSSEQPCSQNQLAGCLGVSPPAALGMVEDLEARGLVSRHRRDSDRRVYDLWLTDEGNDLLGAARRTAGALERDVAAALADRYDELRRLLLELLG